ncbi:MAG: NifB/NifX family molybdenum-iron cluster-binding protein [Rikenellaceae bacterium]
MKIAIPTRDSMIDNHFGHCEYYTIYTIEDGKVISKERVDSPQGCGCKSNIASVLQQMGVTIMIAGNMGEGAKNKLNGSGIEVIRGCAGNPDEVIVAYLNGTLNDSGVACSSHDDHHECSHNHA